ncbi:MAG: hypothetical protein CMB80_08115 [Flammeovirgaceae bacterium]|nr:hypothetical protein [Flammeovirgaceae bacterium]|tara:strand:- start:3496 stop:3915 length:420 start_codon:yes stop_codon:yes gene_type:complete
MATNLVQLGRREETQPIYVMGFQEPRGYTTVSVSYDLEIAPGAAFLKISEARYCEIHPCAHVSEIKYWPSGYMAILDDSFVEVIEMEYSAKDMKVNCEQNQYIICNREPDRQDTIFYTLAQDVIDALYIQSQLIKNKRS